MFKNLFNRKNSNTNMENNDVLQNEDVLQADNIDTTVETETNATETPEIDKNVAEIESLKQQIEELKDKYLRQVAEFDTFRRRTMREKGDMIQTAARDTMTAILPILDDFDRASKNEQLTEGVVLVHQKMLSTLTAKGLKEMETPAGTDFDPDVHEAITEIPVPDMTGKIIDTVEKGYFLNEKIIRYAKVVVGK